MDIAALTAFLAPLLPQLLKVGDHVRDSVASRVGDEVVDFARRLWDKLRGKVEGKEAAREAAEDVARFPDDEDLRTVLTVQLKKLLTEDADLAREVAGIWAEAQAAGAPAIVTTVTASGAGAVAIGGDAVDNTIITGDTARDRLADPPA